MVISAKRKNIAAQGSAAQQKKKASSRMTHGEAALGWRNKGTHAS